MTLTNLLLAGLGGGLGSMARYLTVVSIDKKLNSVFPYGTLAVNVAGSFLLGIILAWFAGKSSSDAFQWKIFLGTGFCGGFTTFSAFAAENISLFEQRLMGVAAIYIFASIICGLIAMWAGYALCRATF